MTHYVYILKCPDCEDEFFDFFEDAKICALKCLSDRPIITQTEVNRNDFGECTDHCDLGTVWTWEEALGNTEEKPCDTVFSKADTFSCPECDPEFDDLDNSIDPEIEEISSLSEDLELEYEFKPTELQKAKAEVFKLNATQRFKQDETLPEIFALYKELQPERRTDPNDDTFWEKRMQEDPRAAQEDFLNFYQRFHELRRNNELYVSSHDTERRAAPSSILGAPSVAGASAVKFKSVEAKDKLMSESIYKVADRKPIPEGMTLEELVEAMEENEDTVECTKCGGLFEKAACTHNKEGFGWCCTNCEPADTLVEEESAEDEHDESLVQEIIDSKLEELEEAATYRTHLDLCPECGSENAFDHETGFCINCGFNL